MTKKIRLILLVSCVVLFFSITPIIVAYSLGYRLDLENRKIVSTGGIYLRIWPDNANIYINSKLAQTTTMFSNSFFVQDLMPKTHIVEVKKDGYFDYKKSLAVKAKEVTKLEHITLFKKDISFQPVTDKTLSPFEKPKPAFLKNGIKNVIAFDEYQNKIYWLSKDGSLNQSDILFKEQKQLSKSFYAPVKGIRISPDGQKILYFNDYEILYSNLNNLEGDKVFLNRFSEKIGDAFWLNNDYIIFTLAGKIKISETDSQGGTNIFDTNKTASKIYFDPKERKLYISDKDSLLVSEPLVQ